MEKRRIIRNFIIFPISFLIILFLIIQLKASWQTDLKEYSANPIFDPSHRSYYPSISYNENGFNGHGETAYYKMWYASHNGSNYNLRYVSSNDGKTWINDSVLSLNTSPSDPNHPVVVYDPSGFGNSSGPYYKMWYWASGGASMIPGGSGDIQAIWYAESSDGINWSNNQKIHQNTSIENLKLNNGISGTHFYHLYGPGYVLYNPTATNTGSSTPTDKNDDAPMSYAYIMYFDTSSEGTTPEGSAEALALAYSTDGINWIRHGDAPVMIPSGNPSEWDGHYIYGPSVLKLGSTYHLWYSGSDGTTGTYDAGEGGVGQGTYYARGIGHATSSDGINWTKDSNNPIAHVQNDVNWRNDRTYTPSVIYDNNFFSGHGDNCQFKMYHSGKSLAGSGEDSYNIIYWAINSGTLTVDLGAHNPSSGIYKNNDENISLLQISLSANNIENWNISSLTFSTSGSINEATDISKIFLYQDTNQNGQKDAGDLLIKEINPPTSDDGNLIFTNLSGVIDQNTTESWILVYSLSGQAAGEENFKVNLENFSAEAATTHSGQIIANLPLSGNLMKIGSISLWDPLNKTNNFEDANQNQKLDPGEIVTYTITIGNAGNIDSPNAKFVDPLPRYTSFIEGSFSDAYARYDSSRHEVIWEGPLKTESTLTFSLKVRIDENIPANHTLENKFSFYPDKNNLLEVYEKASSLVSSDEIKTSQAELPQTSHLALVSSLLGVLIFFISTSLFLIIRKL
jgi:uncharacterized repeat protein (TIGR01451 family)